MMTESLHSINSAIIALLGTSAMFSFKIIEFKDFKSLNIRFMIFITAAFAIGGVMNQSGAADIIYSNIIGIFPSTYSNLYLMILVLTVMELHMLLGNSIITFSVVIPVLMELTQGDNRCNTFNVFSVYGCCHAPFITISLCGCNDRC